VGVTGVKLSKISRNILLTSPAIFSGILLIFSSALATAQETQSLAVSSDVTKSVTPVEGNIAAIVAGAEPTLRRLNVPGGTRNFNRDTEAVGSVLLKEIPPL
jgi:hypothetical protein